MDSSMKVRVARSLLSLAREVLGAGMESNWVTWTEAMVEEDWNALLQRVLPDLSAVKSTRATQTKPDMQRKGARGFEVETTLADGTKIIGSKVPDWDGNLWTRQWTEVTVDGKSFGMRRGPGVLEDYFDEKYASALSRYKKELDRYDVTGHFSDDFGAWGSQERGGRRMQLFYSQLSPEGKKEAYSYYLKKLEEWRKMYPTLEFATPSFADFNG